MHDQEKQGENKAKDYRGLQESRVERDAWTGILDALTRMKETLDAEETQSGSESETQSQSKNNEAASMQMQGIE